MSVKDLTSARLFVLKRDEDETGVSGTGIVAEGVQFSDGTVALRWRSHIQSTALYTSIAACEAIHGHGGKTKVVFVGEPQAWVEGARPAAPSLTNPLWNIRS